MKNVMRSKLWMLAAVSCVVSLFAMQELSAQPANSKEEVITAKTYFSTDKLPANKDVPIMVEIEIKKGWHINANPAEPDHLYPVKLVISSQGKIKSTKILYPKGTTFIEPETNEALKVYENKVEIIAMIQAPSELAGKEEELTVTVDYQACDVKTCLVPSKVKNVYKVKVAAEGEEVKPVNEEYFKKKTSH